MQLLVQIARLAIRPDLDEPLRVVRTRSTSGGLFEDITLSGKPAQLHVRMTDGAFVLDRTEPPGYHPSQPSGPGCDSTCQQPSAQWMFSAL